MHESSNPSPSEPDTPPARRHPGHRAARFTLLNILANLGLAVVKGVAGVVGNSYALVADAMESVLDIFTSLVVLGGLKLAATPPDDDHPYGHGKAEPLASIVVALCIMGAALALAIQSAREILNPQTTPAPYTLAVLVAVVVTKEGMFRWLYRAGRATESNALRTDAWHHRSDAITSLAAFVGISVALAGGEKYASADGWAALFACAIIFYNGVKLMRPSLNEVMDAAPPPDLENAVRDTAMGVKGVAGLHTCKVRKMGFDYFVDLHVLVHGDMSVREGHGIAHDVKDAIMAARPNVRDVLIHIEPHDKDSFVR